MKNRTLPKQKGPQRAGQDRRKKTNLYFVNNRYASRRASGTEIPSSTAFFSSATRSSSGTVIAGSISEPTEGRPILISLISIPTILPFSHSAITLTNSLSPRRCSLVSSISIKQITGSGILKTAMPHSGTYMHAVDDGNKPHFWHQIISKHRAINRIGNTLLS